MADPLPNREQELPDERVYDVSRDDSWADILRAVLEELSVNSLVSGADHTNFDPEEGQLFIPASGSGSWYLGDGTGWTDVTPDRLADGGTIAGDLTLDSGSTTRLHYDTNKANDPLYVQREQAAAETALTLLGTNVGVNTQTPSAPLDVNGNMNVSGNVHVGNILTFEPLASDPVDPPNGSLWFVE